MECWQVLFARTRVFDPQAPFLQRWNKIFIVLCAVALSLDPLFLYVPEIDTYRKCFQLDTKLETAAITLRSATDIFYIIRVIFQFHTGFSAPSSRVFGRGHELVVVNSMIARRYLSSYFLIDILAILPLPQVAVLLIIPNLGGSRTVNTKNLFKFIVSFQFLPRLLRFYQLSKETMKSSHKVAVTLLLYICAGHVIGGFWYLLSIEREMVCWQKACGTHSGCNPSALYCNGHSGDKPNLNDYTFLRVGCPADSQGRSPFNFGMYVDAHNSGVLESRSFFQKILYCFWWALQNLSTLGQNLKTSTDVLEICFAVSIFICGLVLFSFVIGIIQATMLSSTIRAEKIKMKWQDVEHWMDTHFLPTDLRKRIRRHQQYKWQKTKGLDIDNLLNSLTKDLKRDITRHLCLHLLMRVPMFERMDEQLLDAMCDRLKPMLYTEGSCIIREGDPVDEMLFIMRGSLESSTRIDPVGGRSTGFFTRILLRAGDFFGEELLMWSLDPCTSSNLPTSTRTVRSLTEVEAFSLLADDLKFVASQFRRLHGRRLKHTFRFYSQQWRAWAACYIQAAWRQYRKKKLDESLHQEENRLPQEASKTSGTTLSLAASIYASRFAANVLRARPRTGIRNGRSMEMVPLRLRLKPAEPDFTVEEPLL